MDDLSREENFFVHALDKKERLTKNFYSGWNHHAGDLLCYSPAFPYKGEGCDFYALYYESFLRDTRILDRSSANSRI